jgi:hypothetical protein
VDEETAMDASAERLRAAVVALGRTKRNQPIPPALRAELMACARAARARGLGWGEIARGLGVSMTGLERWFAAPPAPGRTAPALRRVRVTASPMREEPRAALCVVSPQGYRVEGLDVAAAAALLRALA